MISISIRSLDKIISKNEGMIITNELYYLQVGLLIRRYLPKIACVLAKTLKPIAALFLLIIITFGVYANLFLFSLMDAKVYKYFSPVLISIHYLRRIVAGMFRIGLFGGAGLYLRWSGRLTFTPTVARFSSYRRRDGSTEHWYRRVHPSSHS